MFIRTETVNDEDEITRLTSLGFDESHKSRNIWQLRKNAPVSNLCLVASDDNDHDVLTGSIRFWPITIAGFPSILLGPLAVDPKLRGQGIGMALVREGLLRAESAPWAFCFVSGEPHYYPKLGFSKIAASQIDLPAPIEDVRLHLISVSGNSIDSLQREPWLIRAAD